ncbi:MAG: hypothetical protein H6732_14015 [Alphaproteobacteria bacterium]|nr:hypothetical protein [Alphaproteobacteria bacterium]
MVPQRTLLLGLLLGACGAPADQGDLVGDDTDDTTPGADDPYAGLPAPKAPAAYSKGTCPELVAGENTKFASGKRTNREFLLRLPADPEGAGVVFMWHGNGDTMEAFDRYLDAKGAAKELDVIAVIPEAGSGGYGLDWSVPPNDPSADATFFDDLLSCLDAQYGIDRRRVYTMGFSAGALWSSWLVMHRAEHLASAVIFSGGSDGSVGIGPKVNPYAKPAWRIPVVMTEGGADDVVAVNFTQMSRSMAGKLRDDRSVAVLCSHTQGHTPPTGWNSWAWDFLDAHVHRSLPSPYADGEDPSGTLPAGCTWE